MTHQKKMDPELLNMVLDTIDKLEKEKLPVDTKLEMDHLGDFSNRTDPFYAGSGYCAPPHLLFRKLMEAWAQAPRKLPS